jgi:SOS-response transcriptional repressor LexA/transcriptional regulator with XRE-family HTH domain
MSLEHNLKELEALRRMLAVTGQGDAFGKEVRLARTQRGMTLESLAAATGMAKSYLSQIETGYAPPPRDEKVRKIAEAIGLEAESLVARAHLSQLPADVRARLARLSEVFDSTEEVIRELVAALAAHGDEWPDGVSKPPAQPGDQSAEAAGSPADAQGSPPAEAGAADSVALDLESLHRSGLLQHLAEWGEERAEARRHNEHWIPIINRISAGPPEGFTDLDYPVGIADEYIPRPPGFTDQNAFALRVDGDSMEPKYHEGDTVIFSPAASVASGNDCFVRFAMTGGPFDEEKTFKRVFFDAEGQVRLQPINEKYPPRLVKPSDIAGIFRAVARYEKL